MPLLGGLEDDLFILGADDEDLTVAELGDVQYGVGGVVGVGAEEGAAGRGCAVPFVGFRGRCFGLLEGGLEVGDGVRFAGRGVEGVFGFEGPEVKNEAGP